MYSTYNYRQSTSHVCGMVDKKALHTGGVFIDREVLMKRMPEVTAGFEDRGDKEKVALVWDGCCRD